MRRAWTWLAVTGMSLASLGCDGESDGGAGGASGGGGSAGVGGAGSGGTSGSGGSATGGASGSGGSAAGGASGAAGSAGSAGSAGASGGGGAAGSGGTIGVGGTGGVGGSKNCAQLEADYKTALTKAKSCSGILPVVQCAESVPDELACPCPTFVEATNTAALAELKALEKQWKDDGCNVIACPAIACVSPGSAACSSAGVCQDLKSSPN